MHEFPCTCVIAWKVLHKAIKQGWMMICPKAIPSHVQLIIYKSQSEMASMRIWRETKQPIKCKDVLSVINCYNLKWDSTVWAPSPLAAAITHPLAKMQFMHMHSPCKDLYSQIGCWLRMHCVWGVIGLHCFTSIVPFWAERPVRGCWQPATFDAQGGKKKRATMSVVSLH
jgi:hypothetical protein